MLDQERKHWLLKTDKKKWEQDKVTGDTYQGQVDNLGTDIIVETEKLALKYDMSILPWMPNTNLDKIFSLSPSAFTYSAAVNGLMFARIESINYPLGRDLTDYHNYKIQFRRCEECLIPFGGSSDTSDVFVGRWLKTSYPPVLMLLNDSGTYMDLGIQFDDSVTNVVYYYPLESTLQPIPISETSSGTYTTNALISDQQIGYPAFWFTCDQTNNGPTVSIKNNTSSVGQQLMMVGNPGNASKYRAKLYVDVDGNLDCTPDGSPTSGWYVACQPKNGYVFNGNATDFSVPLRPSGIAIGDHQLGVSLSSDDSVITMSPNTAWEYINASSYRIPLSTFDGNCINVASNPLTSIFDIHFDERIPFDGVTHDIGFAGIRMSSSNDHSDMYPKYPHELNTWTGLPEWLREADGYSPEHTAIYAIHNTPTYTPGSPETRQTAALLLDPGKSKNDRDDEIIDKYNRTHPYVQVLLNNKPTSQELAELEYAYDHEDVGSVEYAVRLMDDFKELIPYGTWKNDPDTYSAKYIWDGVYPDPPYDRSHDSEQFWEIEVLRIIMIGAFHVWLMHDYIESLTEAFENDERGRVYVLSNDSIYYVNNNATAYPKPERTVARICDIPTSAMQLNGISGLSPTQVVDPKYVRQEASYNLEDKNRLYNDMASRWVRPNVYDKYGIIIQTDDKFVFNSIENLNRVDLINHNNFRVLENLVPEVDPTKVSVASIYTGGTGYAVDDIGVIMVGGFAFTYMVTSVNDVGCVLDVSVTPSKTDTTVHLSNFDMNPGGEGITVPYGTSPTKGNGTGLKIRLQIADFESLQIKKGAIFDDLFALVRVDDGLWLYTYNINYRSEDALKTGVWEKSTLISEFEDSTSGEFRTLSSSESMMVSLLPQRKQLPVCKYSENVDPTSIDTLTTSTFVNVIDTTKTPVEIPNNITNPKTPNQVEVDITKFYCNGILTLNADERTTDSAFEKMKQYNLLRNNCYVFWAWSSSTGTQFRCGCIYRSLNNLRSTDRTTTLPNNKLAYDKYVETNTNTTIVWDVPNVGVMMWIYNPAYKKSEKYSIHPDTKELTVDRITNSWDKIEIRNPTSSSKLSLLNGGRFVYNVWTNCIPYATQKTDSNIYAQYKFVQIISSGTSLEVANTNTPLVGNWQLVFPRVHSFTFATDTKNVAYTPVQMQTIRGTNLVSNGNIIDNVTGYKVDQKTFLIDESSGGLSMRIFNPTTSKWETI